MGGKGGITARNLGRPEGATAEETRKRLLQAAAALFARNGLNGTTLGEIAGAAGLTAPAIYNHFSSKDDLFIAAACVMFDEIAGAIEETIAAPGGWLARVTAILGMIHELYREDMVLQRLGMSALWSVLATRTGSARSAPRASASTRRSSRSSPTPWLLANCPPPRTYRWPARCCRRW
jgi:AcrR family transcriptional regulator